MVGRYQLGFFRKCASAGVPYDAAVSLYKAAQDAVIPSNLLPPEDDMSPEAEEIRRKVRAEASTGAPIVTKADRVAAQRIMENVQNGDPPVPAAAPAAADGAKASQGVLDKVLSRLSAGARSVGNYAKANPDIAAGGGGAALGAILASLMASKSGKGKRLAAQILGALAGGGIGVAASRRYPSAKSASVKQRSAK